MAESEVGCFSGVKTVKTIPKQTYIFSLDTSCLRYSIKCQIRGVPEVICAQQQLACLVMIQGGCSTCPLKKSHKCTLLVWVPSYHSFPKWAIVELRSPHNSWRALLRIRASLSSSNLLSWKKGLVSVMRFFKRMEHYPSPHSYPGGPGHFGTVLGRELRRYSSIQTDPVSGLIPDYQTIYKWNVNGRISQISGRFPFVRTFVPDLHYYPTRLVYL